MNDVNSLDTPVEEINVVPPTELAENLEAEPAAATDDAPQEPANNDSEDEPKKSGVQKRIDKLTKAYREAERERDQYKKQLEALKPPTEDEFNGDYDAYDAAKIGYHAKRAAIEALDAQEQIKEQSRQQKQAEEIQSNWQKQVAEARTRYENFDIVFADDVPITTEVANIIMRTEKGADIAHHLATHKDYARAIAQLDPVSMAVEIGRIEAQLDKPSQKKATSAPAPIAPLDGRASPTVDEDNMTADEWQAWRYEQLQSR